MLGVYKKTDVKENSSTSVFFMVIGVYLRPNFFFTSGVTSFDFGD